MNKSEATYKTYKHIQKDSLIENHLRKYYLKKWTDSICLVKLTGQHLPNQILLQTSSGLLGPSFQNQEPFRDLVSNCNTLLGPRKWNTSPLVCLEKRRLMPSCTNKHFLDWISNRPSLERKVSVKNASSEAFQSTNVFLLRMYIINYKN